MTAAPVLCDCKGCLLRAVPALAHLDHRALGRLERYMTECRAAVGDVLVREGARATGVFIVIEGTAAVFRDGELSGTVGPGEFLGEMALLDDAPRSATVRAMTPMLLLALSTYEFRRFLEEPVGLRAVAVGLATRLRALGL